MNPPQRVYGHDDEIEMSHFPRVQSDTVLETVDETVGDELHSDDGNIAIRTDHEDSFGHAFNTRRRKRKHKHELAHLSRRHHSAEDQRMDYADEPRKVRRAARLGLATPPRNVHCSDWLDMLVITGQLDELNKTKEGLSSDHRQHSQHSLSASLSRPVPTAPDSPFFLGLELLEQQTRLRGSTLSVAKSVHRQLWVKEHFTRLECSRFIPTSRDPAKCGCGRAQSDHLELSSIAQTYLANQTSYTEEDQRQRRDNQQADHDPEQTDDELTVESPRSRPRAYTERWSIRKHTMALPTNAFGTIEFQGGAHPYRSHYLRLSFDADPADIMTHFERVWQIAPPKLIITVQGGLTNFDLQPKLARVFRKGLLKAAKTTGAWIITSGLNAGAVRHVAAALEGSGPRSKIVCIGITPWGLLKKREDFIGENIVVPYHMHSFAARSRLTVLNDRHSYFLFVDNGTVGRYGADVVLRKRLETYIAEKQKIGGGTRSVPVVCVVLEGGTCTIRSVLDYVTNIPRVPVVICDGSGRAADLLAFAHQYVTEDGTLPTGVRPQLMALIQNVFKYDTLKAERLIEEIIGCARQKNLMTVFRMGEKAKADVDYAILTALLKGQNLNAADQLALCLAWNRVDIARSDIFQLGTERLSSIKRAKLATLLKQSFK